MRLIPLSFAFHFCYREGRPLDYFLLLASMSFLSVGKIFYFSLDFTVICFEMEFLFICPVLNSLGLYNLKTDAFSILQSAQSLCFKIFSLPHFLFSPIRAPIGDILGSYLPCFNFSFIVFIPLSLSVLHSRKIFRIYHLVCNFPL